uniref:HECT-type E3 ubiquitin transferase n=1 Tax=Amphimedon queenslandica TaxID=400682 RepID=A0A1X7SR60_AMPQE
MTSEILIGLSSDGLFCSRLCYFVLDVLNIDNKKLTADMLNDTQLMSVLSLLCETANYFLSVLDDNELYEVQEYFTQYQLGRITIFLNNLIFYCIWEQETLYTPIIESTRPCLILLLQRNQRRSFVPQDFLLIRQLKPSKFVAQWKSLNPKSVILLQTLPHTIPHNTRVEIFYEYINNDKAMLGIGCAHNHTPAAYITIHRSRLLEDGYNHLGLVSTAHFKGVIRVKFINEQGLDEAGIDEMGVFKEFLEEI